MLLCSVVVRRVFGIIANRKGAVTVRAGRESSELSFNVRSLKEASRKEI